MEDNHYAKQRQFYRIQYPHQYRPKVRIQGEDDDYDVMELSERGARFQYTGSQKFSAGSEIEVNITFHDGESFQFTGDILRIVKEDVIVRFTEGLPLNRIMKEQVYLRNHFIGYM